MGKLAALALLFAGLGLVTILSIASFDKTRLIFCDVGQGDGILIVSGTKQVVVDGGPGNKMVDCLGEKMPFWDREIEILVLTHPQQDHMEGLIGILARYDVGTVVTTKVPNDTEIFKVWERAVEAEQGKVYVPDIGDKFVIEHAAITLSVLWPDRDQAEIWQQDPPSDLNQSSIVMRLDADGNCAYLTGDISREILEGLIDKPCQILKIAHHGSRTGTNEEILDRASPKIAVIQSGKNNRFGHPHKEVVDLLISKGIRILRNDTDGIVEIDITNGILKLR